MRPDTLFGLEEHMAKLNCKANPLVRLAKRLILNVFAIFWSGVLATVIVRRAAALRLTL